MPGENRTQDVRVRRGRAGLANRLLMFGGTLVAGALLIAILQGPFDTILDHAASISSVQQAATGRKWTRQMFGWAPFWIGMLGIVMLVSGAVYESRRAV